jgi:serine/threonine-protein kinase RsbW
MAEPAVRIEIPASGEYLAVLRAAASGLAAGLSFTYEEIDDLRIAVDEACAQLLARRGSADRLEVSYLVNGAALEVEASVRADDLGEPLPRDGFSWQILRALTDDLDEQVVDGNLRLRFSKRGGRR